MVDDNYFSTFELLKKNKIKLVWFDLRDSAGTTQFEVLPYVDLYFKKQIYRNFNTYYKDIYGGREYSDYYHKKYKINDEHPYEYVKLTKKYEKKLNLSWNIGVKLFDSSYKNFIQRSVLLSKYKFKKTFFQLIIKIHHILNPVLEERKISFVPIVWEYQGIQLDSKGSYLRKKYKNKKLYSF